MIKQKLLVSAMLVAATATATAGVVTSDGADVVLKTKGGFSAATTDGAYSFGLTGRMHLDYNDYDGVMAPGGEDGSDVFFRRARLGFKGHANDWAYEFSYNLTDEGSIDVVNTTFTGWGSMANLTLGQQKENFGLETLTSSNNITAIERSLPSNAFDAGKNIGAKLHGGNDQYNYSVGAFKNAIDSDNELDTALTGRFVFRPYYNAGDLMHIGVGYTDRSGSAADYNSRLGVRGGEDALANRVRARDSGEVGDRTDANLELAMVMGPFHASAEYFTGEIEVDNVDATIDADGYYVQAGYLLTGERRGYKTNSGSFDSIKPAAGTGAWEIFARFDSLDLSNDDAPISVTGEQGDTMTVGLNWYASSLVRMGINYVHAETDTKIDDEDSGDALVARVQVAF